MKTYKIKNTGLFMTRLLTKEDFDSFLCENAKIVTAVGYEINGRLHKEFFPQEERDCLAEDFISWQELRQICYQVIKGRNTPLSFNIVLRASAALGAKIIEDIDTSLTDSDISSLIISVRYDGSEISCVSAVSLNIFSMDKSAEHAWDKYVADLLAANGIGFEEM